MIKHYDDCTPAEKAEFDAVIKKAEDAERKWFKERGYNEADMMYASSAYKNYLACEANFPNARPFDRAPGFRRIFMMGYFYGRDTKPKD